MIRNERIIRAILLFIPVLSVAWSLVLNHLSGPHYLSRTDPEYVYLLNGMNVSLLEFDRIGHVDHPGTPFQLITGLFITLIYWMTGSGSLISDLISNPEKYLFLSSFFLSLATAGLFYWISILEFRRSRSLTGALLIPATYMFYYVIVDLPSRYIPDRFLMITVLLFTGLSINYLYRGYSQRKFALASGLLMALGVVTKINFIPFLVLPLFFIGGWRDRIVYAVSLAFFSVVLFLPVYDKFDYFRRFAIQISTHEGLYGGGNEQMLNLHAFAGNLWLILRDNPAFIFIVLLSLVSAILLLSRSTRRITHKRELYVLTGFLVVAFASIFMVAKHYKNYYMIPALSLSGLALYVTWVMSSQYRNPWFVKIMMIPAGILFLYLTGSILGPGYEARIDRKHQEELVSAYMHQHISGEDYLLVEPTWMAGPMVENGLVYGISYIGHRHYFYNDYEQAYPNTLTWEGRDRPLRYFRTLDADNEGILKSGRDLYLLSTPGRNAPLIVDYLDSCAAAVGVNLVKDTLYSNFNIQYHLLRIRNASGWTTVQERHAGFEEVADNVLFTDDGRNPLKGPFTRVENACASGVHSLKLGGEITQSPSLSLYPVLAGDRIEMTVKRSRGNDASMGVLEARYATAGQEEKAFESSEKLSTIHSRWELVRLAFTLEETPADSLLVCDYAYRGDGMQLIDDLVIRHYSATKRQAGSSPE